MIYKMSPLHNLISTDFSFDDIPNYSTLNSLDELKSFFCLPNAFNSSLNIIHVNIQSLKSNFDELSLLFSDIFDKLSILILSEIWCKDDEINLYEIPNFESHYCCRYYNKSGGIIVYSHNKYDFIEISSHMSTAEIVILHSNLLDLTIISIYRSHSFTVEQFNLELQQTLSTMSCKNVILIGDLNIDILKPNTHANTYIDLLCENGYLPLIFDVTRILSNTCIDHIFFKNSSFINHKIYSSRFISSITDHYPVACKIILDKALCNQSDIKINKKMFNYSKCKFFLSDYDLNLKGTNAISLFDDFHNKLNAIQNNFSYYKKYSNLNNNNPWVTSEIICMIKSKEKLYKKYRRYPGDRFYSTAYKTCVKVLKYKIRTAKNKYFLDKFENCCNSKEQWNVVNNILNKKTKKSTLPVHTSDFQLSNIFNQYFTSLNKCTLLNNTNYVLYLQPYPHSFFWTEIEADDLNSIIHKLNANKSSGVDGMSVKFLKLFHCTHHTVILSTLFNKLVKEGIFPDCLKTSIVSPIFKKGDSNNLSNYRPISVFPILSKIFEKIMHDKMLSYLSSINFFSKNQFGFLPGSNTENALVEFTNFIYNSVDSNRETLAIFLDVSKAFDSVNHNILLQKLFSIGFRGNIFKFFESYLSNRFQFVKINNTLSNKLGVTRGIFQGTLLGPLLFLIYINDLCNLNLNAKIICFADDSTLLYSCSNLADLNTQINEDLKQIRRWFIDNDLTINCDKTKYLHFKLFKNNSPNLPIIFHSKKCNLIQPCNCQYLENANTIKYLGLHIDSNLKWKSHINFILNKMRFLISQFHHLKSKIHKKFLLTLYNSWIQSHLSYGVIAWGGDYITNINRILNLQNKFIKLIIRSDITIDIIHYRNLGILPLRYLYFFKVCIYIYNNPQLFSKRNTVNSRRPNHIFNIPKPNKNILCKNSSFLAPKFYNSLPLEIQNAETLNKFKKSLKTYVLNIPNIENCF